MYEFDFELKKGQNNANEKRMKY